MAEVAPLADPELGVGRRGPSSDLPKAAPEIPDIAGSGAHPPWWCWRAVLWLESPPGLIAVASLVFGGMCVFFHVIGYEDGSIKLTPRSGENMVIVALGVVMGVEAAIRSVGTGFQRFITDFLSLLDIVVIIGSVIVQLLVPPFGAVVLLLRFIRLFYIAKTSGDPCRLNKVGPGPITITTETSLTAHTPKTTNTTSVTPLVSSDHRLATGPGSLPSGIVIKNKPPDSIEPIDAAVSSKTERSEDLQNALSLLQKLQHSNNNGSVVGPGGPGMRQKLDPTALDGVLALLSVLSPTDDDVHLSKQDEGDIELDEYIKSNFSVQGAKSAKSGRSIKRNVKKVFHQAKAVATLSRNVKLFSHHENEQKKDRAHQGEEWRTTMNSKQLETVMQFKKNSLYTDFDSWGYDMFMLHIESSGNSLVAAAEYMFATLGLFDEFDIAKDKFYMFMFEIQAGYRNANPYHNSLHGADIGQAVFFLLHTGGLVHMHQLSKLEVMAALLAAIIHDFKHPGVNNNFCIRNSMEVAIMSNDASVLENFHVSQAFVILQKPQFNWLSSLNDERYRRLRSLVISLVLSTDMAHHFKHFNGLTAKIKAGEGRFAIEADADKVLLLETIMHYADVSNPARGISLAQRWTYLVCEEFYRQGDLEKHLGISVSPFFDRTTANTSKSQKGFIQYIVKPFTEVVADGILNAETGKMLKDQIESNHKFWNETPEGAWELPEALKVQLPVEIKNGVLNLPAPDKEWAIVSTYGRVSTV